MEPTNPYASPQHPAELEKPPPVPLSLGGILRTSIWLYASNATAVVGLTILFWLPMELMQSYYDYFLAQEDDPLRSLRTTLWMENLIGIIPMAGTFAMGNAAMKGERPSLWFGLAAGLEAWPRIIGTRIVVSLITLLAFFLFILPGIYVLVRSVLAEPVAVMERLNPMENMKRSFDLTHRAFWRYFALLFVSLGAVSLAGALTSLPPSIFPEIDHWLLSAGLSLFLDVIAAWPALVLVAAYWASAHATSSTQDESLISATPA